MVHVALITAYNENGELLIGKRLDSGLFTLPGGHLNPGETPRQAAIRELYEETGLKCISMSFLTQYTSDHGVVLYCFSAFVQGTPHGNLDPDQEVQDWKFIDVSEGLPAKIYNNLHGPQDIGNNLLKRAFNLKKAEETEDDLIKADNLITHPNPIERVLALKLNPSLDNLFLASLDHNPAVWETAIDHPNFNRDIALKLAGAPVDSKREYAVHQYDHLLNKDFVDDEILNKLYNTLEAHKPEEYSKLINKIAKHPKIDSSLWLRLYNNPDLDHENRVSLLNSPDAHADILNNAIKEGTLSEDSKALELGKKAIEHSKVDIDFIENLVRSAIGSNSESLLTIAAHALANRKVSDKLITDLQNQAKHRFEHNHARLRLAAISGPGASQEALDRALEDPSAYVRNGVPFAQNASPKHINETIDRAVKDRNRDGIKALLNHPAISGKHLKKLIKSEEYGITLNKNDDLKAAKLMLGGDLDHETLKAARLMAGYDVDETNYRVFLIEEDGDAEKAALRTFGIEPNKDNIKTLRVIRDMSKLNKAEDIVPVPEDIKNVYPEGAEVAEALKRAFNDSFVFNIKLAGKHSKGALVARDEKEGKSYLLKPGNLVNSPAAGVNDEKASQSVREAAFYYIAKLWGLDKWIQKTDLILIDNKEYAVMELLPWTYETLDHRRKEDPGVVNKVLGPLINNGIVTQWAVLDYVLGNPDRHANNLLIDENGSLKLIDHGSAFAGEGFSPGKDPNAFIPAYLRANVENFNKLSTKDKLNIMPRVSESVNKELLVWVNGLDPQLLGNALQRYGIESTPEVMRLVKIKASANVIGVDRAINLIWAGT